MLARVSCLKREHLRVKLLGDFPFPDKLAVLDFADSVRIDFAIRRFLPISQYPRSLVARSNKHDSRFL